MAELGMDTRELESFKRVLQLPHGIILVTGPTGSGKTSTLYTALNEINDASAKSSRLKTRSNISSRASTRSRSTKNPA
jgi:type II secretory ATPase GspE/PulE/Tfp pilus assembly ATPase PilB-like protein